LGSNEDIMEKLNIILEEIQKLQGTKAECININSGTFTIEAGSKSPIEIREAGEEQHDNYNYYDQPPDPVVTVSYSKSKASFICHKLTPFK